MVSCWVPVRFRKAGKTASSIADVSQVGTGIEPFFSAGHVQRPIRFPCPDQAFQAVRAAARRYWQGNFSHSEARCGQGAAQFDVNGWNRIITPQLTTLLIFLFYALTFMNYYKNY